MCWVPCCRDVFSQHQTPIPWQSLQSLKGKDHEGRWLTARAKEYPGALNAALVHSHVFQISQQRCHSRLVPAKEEHQLSFETLYRGDWDMDAQQMQPDYAKTGMNLDGLD